MPTTKYKSIKVFPETYKDLAKEGTLGDTFDSVIQRLLKGRKTELVQSK